MALPRTASDSPGHRRHSAAEGDNAVVAAGTRRTGRESVPVSERTQYSRSSRPAKRIGVVLEDPNRPEPRHKLVETAEPIRRPFLDHLQDQVIEFGCDRLLWAVERERPFTQVLSSSSCDELARNGGRPQANS